MWAVKSDSVRRARSSWVEMLVSESGLSTRTYDERSEERKEEDREVLVLAERDGAEDINRLWLIGEDKKLKL